MPWLEKKLILILILIFYIFKLFLHVNIKNKFIKIKKIFFYTWDCRGKQKGIQILLISCWKWAFILFFLPSFLKKFNGPPLKLIFLCCSFLTSSTLWFGVLRLLFKLKMLTFIVGGSCSLWNVDCWPSNLNYPFIIIIIIIIIIMKILYTISRLTYNILYFWNNLELLPNLYNLFLNLHLHPCFLPFGSLIFS